MMEFQIKIAGQIISVRAMYESTKIFLADYVSEGAPAFSVETCPEDILSERIRSAAEDLREGIAIREFSDAYLETIALQRKIAEQLFSYDVLLLHGSVIAVDGQGYLFTAKSGTGKSTHTRLWRELLGQRAVMVDDDKPFLRITQAGVRIYGTPWNGKHRIGSNISVPLKAVCILERGEQNQICRIPASQVLSMLLQQTNRPMEKDKMPHYLDLVERLTENVRFYRLRCNMDQNAAKVAFEAMSQEEEGSKV